MGDSALKGQAMNDNPAHLRSSGSRTDAEPQDPGVYEVEAVLLVLEAACSAARPLPLDGQVRMGLSMALRIKQVLRADLKRRTRRRR